MWLFKNILLLKNWPAFYRGSLDLRLRNGLRIKIPKRDDICIVHEIFTEDCYHLPLLQSNPVVLDIGAHIGAFTLSVLHAYPLARVVAVEANNLNYKYLKENIVRNGFANQVILLNKAVAPTEGRVMLNINPNGDSGHHSLKYTYTGNVQQEVDAITLDSLIGERCDLLKIDIEGMEEPVLSTSDLSRVKHIRSEKSEESFLASLGFAI